LIAGCDAVVNLVGILHERGPQGSFLRVHAELPKKIVAACRNAGVNRYVHMSALHADVNGASAYLRSKGQGEAEVKAAGDTVAWTIFRPSVVFGRGDSFLNMFAQLLGVVPVVALASPDARFQPIWVEDVARAFVDCILKDETVGQSYDLCGPNVYTLRDLVKYVGEITGRRRPIIGLGDKMSYLQATVMEWLPGPLMTRDNYYSMKKDSVCDCPFPSVFGFQPTAIEAIVPRYLGHQAPRARYNDFRVRAGR
jgi:NADH dehydrogenase